ncbi:MAG: ABC transporter permease [Saprospiraceae bacterium]|nr:ABC transporter permease [Saprospiraceae bacterium]
MFQNNIKIALRSLWNQRFFTGLNLFGLAIGLAVSLTLALYVKNELSFDRQNANADRTYRVNLLAKWDDEEQKMATAPNITGPALKEGLKEVEAQVRILKHDFGKTAFVNYEEQRLTETNLYWADSSLFSVFDIPLLAGDPRTALTRPQTVILSETTARKIFKDNDPVGKTITVDNADTLEVTGVFADLPANSTFDANIIGSFYSVEWANNNLYWSNASYETYLVLAEGTDPQAVEKQANAIYEKATEADQRWFSMYLQPLTDIHLRATDVDSNHTSRLGDYQQVVMLGYLSLAVLLLACFNYVNMATARSQQRFREVGINKTLGASTGMMMKRFFTETGLVVAIAMGLGLLLTLFSLPFLNQLTDKGLQLSALLEGGWAWGLPMLWAAVTFGAGLYPAFFLSRFSPKEIMQTSGAGGKLSGHRRFRQGLVVGQFVVCIGLMVGTLVLYRQLSFISDKKLGFEPAQVVSINTSAATKPEQIDGLMNEYRNLAAVQSLCRAQTYPGKSGSGRNLNKPGATENQSIQLTTNRVTPDFEKVLGLKLLAGKTVPLKDPKDTTTEVILNETAIKYMGWTPEDAIGKPLPDLFYMGPSTVVGVVEDFHHESLHQAIGAYAFHNGNSESRPNLLVKLSTGDLRLTMTQLQDGFKKHMPASAFDFTFVDDHLNTLYRNEHTLAKVVLLFSSMAIFIACLGLFGLAAFAAERRTKEIGIRKVLGATVNGLVGLMAKDFLKPVLVAFFIAAPLAWLFMDHWLDSFAYRTDVHWSLFVLVGLAALAVAFVTVSFQSVRAALAKPVESLRSE